LRAISHSLGAHTEAFHAAADADSDDEGDNSDQPAVVDAPAAATAAETVNAAAVSAACDVCLIAPRDQSRCVGYYDVEKLQTTQNA